MITNKPPEDVPGEASGAFARCRAVYPTQPGDRVVECGRPAGHSGDHREDKTNVTWPEPGPNEGTRAWLEAQAAGRHPGTVHLIRLFAWSHLPAHLQPFSRPCGLLAVEMVGVLPDGPELTAGLRKLREAKDCFVTQALEPL